MNLLYLALTCTCWMTSGAFIAAWWFTRAKRRAERDMQQWIDRLPQVSGLPPVRTLPPTYQRASWVKPNGLPPAHIPTSGFWAPSPHAAMGHEETRSSAVPPISRR